MSMSVKHGTRRYRRRWHPPGARWPGLLEYPGPQCCNYFSNRLLNGTRAASSGKAFKVEPHDGSSTGTSESTVHPADSRTESETTLMIGNRSLADLCLSHSLAFRRNMALSMGTPDESLGLGSRIPRRRRRKAPQTPEAAALIE